jgi:hypothetical protein
MTQKEFARLGGRARAKALTPERRREIARNAGLASAALRKSQDSSMPKKYSQTENKP